MGARRQAREMALQALYQCDTLNDWSAESERLFFEAFKLEDLAGEDLRNGLMAISQVTAEDSAENSEDSGHNVKFDFATLIIAGVREHLAAIDAAITAASRNWTIGRMARVDRNILRIGAFEINYLADIPTNVSINEAIEIAKRFGSDDSPMFINGVLDRVASDFRTNQAASPIGFSKASNS